MELSKNIPKIGKSEELRSQLEKLEGNPTEDNDIEGAVDYSLQIYKSTLELEGREEAHQRLNDLYTQIASFSSDKAEQWLEGIRKNLTIKPHL